MTPRVSVVVATRDRRPMLARALASVGAQRFRDFEILVVDDGSVDGTGAWLREEHPGAFVVELGTSCGAAAARNRGVERARGEIVAFLDDDDVWHPSYLETQVAQFDAHPDALLCSTAHVERDGAGRVSRPDLRPLLDYADPLLHLLAECPLHTLSIIACRRSAFASIGPFDETLAIVHDLDWYLRLVGGGGRREQSPAALVERGVPGGLVSRHRRWYAEERTVHERVFAATPIAHRDRRRVRAARALLFARVGLTKADIRFGLARLAEAFLSSPLHSARIAALRLMRREGREAAEAWNAQALEAR
jgi:glycosyltransferase involved in cell wall biosynthesis